MKGLIYHNLTYLTNKKSVLSFGGLFVLYLLISFTTKDFPIWIGGIFVYIMAAYGFQMFDNKTENTWNKFERIFPISKNDIMLSKFITSFIYVGIGVIISILYEFIASMMNHIPLSSDIITFNIIMFMVAIIIVNVMNPFIMKFNLIMGKVVAITLLVAIVAGINIDDIISMFPTINISLACIFLLIADVLFTIISYFICCKFYENIEF